MEMGTQYELASGEIRDSMLIQIIEVVSNDSLSFHAQNFSPTRSFKHMDDEGMIITKMNFDTSFVVSDLDTMGPVMNDRNIFYPKLTVNGSNVFEWVKDQGVVQDSQDRFEVRFSHRLAEAGLPHNVTINIDDAELSSPSNGNIAINVSKDSPFGLSQRKQLELSNYRPYLIKKIAPSITLSSLLFLLVLGTFILLEKRRREQLQLHEMKNEFMNNMTHEFKTPIATVQLAIESLQKYGTIDDRVKREEYLDLSTKELTRLDLLVDKVLKMSSVQKEGFQLYKEEFNLSDVIHQVKESLRAIMNKEAILFSEDIDSNVLMVGDKTHLTSVIYNLLDNSIKYRSENPKIHVSLKDHQQYVKLIIKDNGIGIDKKHHKHIYERFFRVPRHDIHNIKGHGLGLHYVKTILDQHKADIQFDSQLGDGTKIEIIFNSEEI